MQTENAIIEFNPNAIETYGNSILNVIVQHEEARNQAEHALAQANEREKVIDFELCRTVLWMHQDEQIDLHAIYDGNKDSSQKLYRDILVKTGALERRVDENSDRIIYDFTDPKVAGKFDFTKELEEADPDEYKKRRSRRNGLNLRLARVCKAAVALNEADATTDDMRIEKTEDGGLEAVITKGPAEVMGEEASVQIFSKSVSPVEGASVTPTVTGLAKLADSVHKPKTSKADVEQASRNEGGSVADFHAVMNAAIMAIRGLEGEPDRSQIDLLNAVMAEIGKCIS